MNRISRRAVLRTLPLVGVGLARLHAADEKLRVGVTDWNLRLGAKPEAVPLAASLGFDAVQLSFGRRLAGDKLPTDDPETIARYLQLSAAHKIPIDGTCVDRLHDNGLKSDPLAPRWVRDAIRLTAALHTKVLLVPLFGKWALTTRAEMEYTGDALRELAPRPKRPASF
jgi:L-ribulose-5-phosphate 3-epimerase